MTRKTDIICAGEILIDFIGHQNEAAISNTRDYHRYLGGSPTNVSMNLARLGMNVKLAATVGDDGFGNYMLEKLKDNGVQTDLIRVDNDTPTSVIFVSKTTSTPDFVAYRHADTQILGNQIPEILFSETSIFHTTAFALSRDPAQQTILMLANKAFKHDCTLSIDLNYSPRIWKNRKQALAVFKEYCSYDPLVKISEDDMERLFGEKKSHKDIFDFFHNEMNVSSVCLTLGSEGVKFSRKHKEIIALPAARVDNVLDATGAGDAFWSGFLFAHIKGYSVEKSLKIALSLAAIKLQHVGRLPQHIDILTKLLDFK
ncbi:carbohydrate kinase family protein [Dokdonia sp. Hel_I_53]|uniref:carbohydrate kinase family protein n=1 Tax=Dokdonia sp. Hel_I_53 TaxID=1566287 RepID=UPI00119F0728|nr:sugar kinase [Dokdonia sp. Hel_I_53]